jgi:KaiC/GvpD/RAD55 family RecA-like ATPase
MGKTAGGDLTDPIFPSYAAGGFPEREWGNPNLQKDVQHLDISTTDRPGTGLASSSDGNRHLQDRIPQELAHYVNRRSYSLLIKGEAGTGKTTLALTLLRELENDVNLLYLSTRISPAQLFEDHPWLDRAFGSKKRGTEANPESKKGPSREFVDARLDEPGPLFEKVTSELMDVRAPLIVIDTWSSLEEYSGYEDIQMNVKVLQTWRERVGAKLILVGEDPNDPTLDSLVDGVVVLKQGGFESRRTREMTFSKLYGTDISNPTYSFTLNRGIFRSFPHYKPGYLLDAIAEVSAKAGRSRTRLKSRDRVSTGYPKLDTLLGGGMTVGSVVSLELSPEVDSRLALFFIGPLVAEFAARGNPVMLLPWKELEGDFTGRIFSAATPRHSEKAISFFWPGKRGRSEVRRIGGIRESSEALERLVEHSRQLEEGNPSEARLAVVFVDSLAMGRDFAGAGSMDSSTLRSDSSLTVLVTRSGNRAVANASGVAENKIRLVSKNATLFVEPEAPFSQLHGLSISSGPSGHRVDLEPMV